MKDYYNILGIARTANPEEIKRAYRSLAMKHHPDRGGDVTQFQEVQEAYATLSDAEKKSQYDNPRPQFGGRGPGGFDFNSIFDMFGIDPRTGNRPNNARVNIWISLSDAITGGPRTVSIQNSMSTTNVEINIPRGVHEGDNIRYPGLVNGQDLIVTYRIKPDAVWQLDGLNLISDTMIDIWDLIVGIELKVRDPVGNEYAIKVPPETQPGAVLRVRGRGYPGRVLPNDRSIQPAGDLLVRLHAKITSPVNPEIVAAIQKSRGL